MIRYIAGTCVLFGAIIGIILFIQGQPFLAIEAILGGVYLGFSLYMGFSMQTSKVFAVLGLIIGILGFFNKVSSNADIQKPHNSAFNSFVSPTSKCIPSDLQQAGLMACALQDQKNAIEITSDAAKSIYLDPTAKLVDAAYTATQEKAKDKCAQAFKNAYAVCPSAFSSMTDDEIKALNKALE